MQEIDELIAKITNIENIQQLEKIKAELLGKEGLITQKFRLISKASNEEKVTLGQKINSLKIITEEKLSQKKEQLDDQKLQAELLAQEIDITLPVKPITKGSVSPISQCLEEMMSIFAQYNFEVAEGPNIENEWYNFSALNIDENHPSRDSHDSFYFKQKADEDKLSLLRTHTSPVQIRYMKNNKPPFRFIAPGRVYRADYDATHTPMFHQVEGVIIDENISFTHFKGFIMEFVRKFFESDSIEIIFRPSFFPFTEPSAEVDIKTKEFGKFLEVMGCGMVHPKVLENVGLDPQKYQGFAFGLGVERFAMLKYGINDLRKFFEGDIRWMKHYNFSAFDCPSILGGLTK